MARTHHDLIDLVQYFRGEQPQIVFERLQVIVLLIRPVAMTEHLAQGFVLIGQFLNPVIVGVQTQPQHTQNEDLPLRHTRAPIVGISFLGALFVLAWREHLFE